MKTKPTLKLTMIKNLMIVCAMGALIVNCGSQVDASQAQVNHQLTQLDKAIEDARVSLETRGLRSSDTIAGIEVESVKCPFGGDYIRDALDTIRHARIYGHASSDPDILDRVERSLVNLGCITY